MKVKSKKILCIILILITLFNFICPNISFAAEEEEDSGLEKGLGVAKDIASAAVDGVAGILLMPAKLILLVVGAGANFIASEVAEVGANDDGEVWVLKLDDIFFHNAEEKQILPILNVNFFEDIGNDGNHKIIYSIRDNIATWYYALRNLAIIISLLVLVYIGIRMAISTLAEDKAKYKSMLTDWIVGFITIFLLHYIIIATIYVNEALVNALYTPPNSEYNDVIKNYMTLILETAIESIGFVDAMSATVVYVGMTIMTFMFLYTYMKRMITVAFLIIIAPLITVTYSIDKMGDGKSQALNTWLKEFIYNVLIQPFHCIIFMVFSQLIYNILSSPANSLGGGLLVIIIMIFMRQAETIIRTIFGFGNAKSLGDIVATGALVASSVSAAGKTLGALKGAQKESKGGSGGSSSKGADKKPNLKDTSNAGGAQRQTSNSGGSNGQSGNSSNAGSSNSSSGGSNSSSNSGGSSGGDSSSSNDTSNSTSNTSSGDNTSRTTSYATTDVDMVTAEARSYNTEAVQDAEDKFKNVLTKYANANIKAVEIAAGIGLGGAMKGDIPTMIAGANFAKAGVNVTKIGGEKVISGFRNTAVAKNSRINEKTDKVIDAYDNLKAEKGWSDDRMLDETERVLDIKDTSTIKNEKLREYAEKVQDLRTEYEEEYKVPNDMVLDRISKVQSGQVKRSNKKYTKKPKTRPIDRGRRQKPNKNGQNRN